MAPHSVARLICFILSIAPNVGHPSIATGKLITITGNKNRKTVAAYVQGLPPSYALASNMLECPAEICRESGVKM